MRSRPPTWLRVVGGGVPPATLLWVPAVAWQPETGALLAATGLAVLGAFLPASGLTLTTGVWTMALWQSRPAALGAMVVCLLLLWRPTTAVDKVLAGGSLLWLGVAISTGVRVPAPVWMVPVVLVAVVASLRASLMKAASGARSPAVIDRQPSRHLAPITSDRLREAGWPLEAEVDGFYLHTSSLAGTYGVAWQKFVFLITRFGTRWLMTTNAGGPRFPHELAQRAGSRASVDELIELHEGALVRLQPAAGEPTPVDDVVEAHLESRQGDTELIDAGSWRLAVQMLAAVFTRPDRPLGDGAEERVRRWLSDREPAAESTSPTSSAPED